MIYGDNWGQHTQSPFPRTTLPKQNSISMSRIPRILLERIPYHITQRSNACQQVFSKDRDYLLYQDLLKHTCGEERLSIWAYALMPNHVHVVAMPGRGTSMAQAMGRTNADFARHYNLRKRSCGHVWQARYHSTPLDSSYLAGDGVS